VIVAKSAPSLTCDLFRVIRTAVDKQRNRRLHFARTVHSRHPFPPIGDAAYRQDAGEGPSHGHGQHAHKLGKDRACASGDILADRQTDMLITILRNRSR